MIRINQLRYFTVCLSLIAFVVDRLFTKRELVSNLLLVYDLVALRMMNV